MLKSELVEKVTEQEAIIEAVKLRMQVAIDDSDCAADALDRLNKRMERLKEAVISRLVVIEPEELPYEVIEELVRKGEPVIQPAISKEVKLLRYLKGIICRMPGPIEMPGRGRL